MILHTPQNATLSLTVSAANLKRLAIIRSILILAIATSFAYTTFISQLSFVQPVHLLILSCLIIINGLTYWRLQQVWPVTDQEYFAQLLVDTAGLTMLLYFSGGASNPFVSFYLVPIAISAALLPARYSWAISSLSFVAYSLMLFYYRPLEFVQPEHSTHMQHSQTDQINSHIIGMWLTFALSTLLITYFVVKIATALREREQQLAIKREDDLRDEQILAVATLAAGTAHELGTPLSTMGILLEELEQEYKSQTALCEDFSLLKRQLDSCKKILKGLVSTANTHSQEDKNLVSINDYIESILTHWQVIRPAGNYQLTIDDSCHQCYLLIDLTLEQAIANLLNNAADSGTEAIEINVLCQNQQMQLSIRDYGTGIPLDIIDNIGKPFISHKGKGLGLGLFLTHATISRLGGDIALYNHDDGGTLAEIHLPLANNNTINNS
jgi:two-component system sensor histidine kinase RegB